TWSRRARPFITCRMPLGIRHAPAVQRSSPPCESRTLPGPNSEKPLSDDKGFFVCVIHSFCRLSINFLFNTIRL
ncbi:hypothetical protein, partial [Alteromonas sp. MTD1]|uniref:hypothetical protein n=1 Tax=Alteromonas sp. MTD1 TaxID=3057962 RepID=UPI0036F39C47